MIKNTSFLVLLLFGISSCGNGEVVSPAGSNVTIDETKISLAMAKDPQAIENDRKETLAWFREDAVNDTDGRIVGFKICRHQIRGSELVGLVSGFRDLKQLELDVSALEEVAIPVLENLKSLETLVIHNVGDKRRHFEKLGQKLPSLKISFVPPSLPSPPPDHNPPPAPDR